jgi:glycosyltransferase involved in cell wall biosynthesis
VTPRESDFGVDVWRLKMPSTPKIGWVGARYAVYRKIAEWSRLEEIDLVEVPDWEGWAAGWPSLSVPVISRLHGSSSYFAAELNFPVEKTVFFLERAALRRSEYCCSVSRYTAAQTERLFDLKGRPPAIIYNAVDVPDGAGTKERSTNDVLFSGTLTQKKGIASLIDAWPMVLSQRSDARLHVYGKDTTDSSGPSMREALIARLQDSARQSVIFHGHTARATLLEQLRKVRAAVFPSLAEAFAMAPLEAMAQGCPTIYSTKGSGPELIDDGVDGLLVNPDRLEEIARSILRVMSDDALAARLGDAGREKVRRCFSTSTAIRTNEHFYLDCLHRFDKTVRN